MSSGPFDIGKIFDQGRGFLGSLVKGPNILAPHNWKHSREQGTYTNSVPDQHSSYPDGQHTFAFFNKYVIPVGTAMVWQFMRLSIYSNSVYASLLA